MCSRGGSFGAFVIFPQFTEKWELLSSVHREVGAMSVGEERFVVQSLTR